METEGQGRRPPQPVLVEISTAEVVECHRFAVECERLRSYAGNAGWRGGQLGARQIPGVGIVSGSLATIVVGKVGEYAMCRLAGAPVDLAMRGAGDGGKDLLLPCGSVQVKTSTKVFDTVLIRCPPERVDWFVFARWIGTENVVSILGYAFREIVAASPAAPSPRGSWMNHAVPISSLRPIRQLLAIRPITEVF